MNISIEAIGREIVRLEAIHETFDIMDFDARKAVQSDTLAERAVGIHKLATADVGKAWAWGQRDALESLALLRRAESLPDVMVQALLALETLERTEHDDDDAIANVRRALVSAVLVCSREAGIDWRQFQHSTGWFEKMAGDVFPAVGAA